MTRPTYPGARVNPNGYLAKVASIIWLDLETTGLEEGEGFILEIAVQSADPADPLKCGTLDSAPIRCDVRLAKSKADEYVLKMHTKNGLWDDVEASPYTLEEVDAQLAEAFALSEGERTLGKRHMLAGNSIGSFDLKWIRRHLPKFARTLSHRVFDVSTLIAAAEMLGWEYERQEPAHRAADDVVVSQNTLRSIFAFLTQQ